MADDYYQLLGVPEDATGPEIKKAFRKIARACHPDVAGDDPAAEARFKAARRAYEMLSDPLTRGRYDRRGQSRAAPRGSFFDAFYRSTGRREGGGRTAGTGPARSGRGRRDPRNDLDLDDLFNDVADFGFGGEAEPANQSPGGASRRGGSAPSSGHSSTDRSGAAPGARGADVHVQVEVPEVTARKGGSVTVRYHRMQRAVRGARVARGEDVAEVRLLPGCRSGQVFRERGLGDAGPHGGPYGDLLVQVRVAPAVASPPPDPSPPPSSAPGAQASHDGDPDVVDVGVVEAILGGRIEVALPGGAVRVVIPPGTSSGARLRLKGRGPGGGDRFLRVRVVVPRDLDAESRALIARFGELNPGT